ncbi:MAG: hypothetical protein GEV11_28720 [Streptosporangiales bacterium]|nr:hypothetical protein [Streptosporangiales bacterium]
MITHGWGMAQADVVRIGLLDWMHDTDDGAGPRKTADFAAAFGVEPEFAVTVARQLEEAGLVTGIRSTEGGDLRVRLTPAGKEQVLARRRRRGDQQTRHRSARDAVLAWLARERARSGNGMRKASLFFGDHRSVYEGRPFESAELDAAARELSELGLAAACFSSDGSLLAAQITEVGLDCVGRHRGAVESYVAERYGAPEVTATAGKPGRVHPEDALTLASALREAAPQLTLSPDERAELTDITRQLEREAIRGEPDQSWMVGLLQRAARIAGRCPGGALGRVMSLAIGYAIRPVTEGNHRKHA